MVQCQEDPSAEPGHQQTWDIVVQKLDAGGNISWRPGGLPLEISSAGFFALPSEPALTSDGSGEAIVIWRDMRFDGEGKASIYAQRIDEQGLILWQAGGIKVSSTSLNPRPRIINIGKGETVVSYSFNQDFKELHIQNLDANGDTLWSPNGITITTAGFSSHFISHDGQGGVIVAWGSEDARVQRVTAEGSLLWDSNGVKVNP